MTIRAQRPRARGSNGHKFRKIDRYDRDLLIFAIQWLPYGGAPDDETLPTFGLSYEEYLDRVRAVVEHNCRDIHPDTVARLLRMCDRAAEPTSPDHNRRGATEWRTPDVVAHTECGSHRMPPRFSANRHPAADLRDSGAEC